MNQLKNSLTDPGDVIPGNSNKERAAKTHNYMPEKPALSSKPEVKKENPFFTFYKAVFPGTFANVKQSLWKRFVWAVQDTLYKSVLGFLDDYMYDGQRNSAPANQMPRSSLTSGNQYWSDNGAPRLAPGYPFKIITYATRRDAEEVLKSMIAYLDQYHKIPVAFYYDYSSQSTESTDNNWGWRSLEGVTVKPEGNGYILTLPAPQAL